MWKMKKSPSVKGRNNLTKPAVSYVVFSFQNGAGYEAHEKKMALIYSLVFTDC